MRLAGRLKSLLKTVHSSHKKYALKKRVPAKMILMLFNTFRGLLNPFTDLTLDALDNKVIGYRFTSWKSAYLLKILIVETPKSIIWPTVIKTNLVIIIFMTWSVSRTDPYGNWVTKFNNYTVFGGRVRAHRSLVFETSVSQNKSSTNYQNRRSQFGRKIIGIKSIQTRIWWIDDIEHTLWCLFTNKLIR